MPVCTKVQFPTTAWLQRQTEPSCFDQGWRGTGHTSDLKSTETRIGRETYIKHVGKRRGFLCPCTCIAPRSCGRSQPTGAMVPSKSLNTGVWDADMRFLLRVLSVKGRAKQPTSRRDGNRAELGHGGCKKVGEVCVGGCSCLW